MDSLKTQDLNTQDLNIQDHSAQELSTQELMDTVGGFNWGDFLGGLLFGTDLVCVYTKNPYPCGAAIAGHGIQFLLSGVGEE